ncbi:UNVERIFIED_ORG: putative MATE family efflux protein [Anoxybacillus amylolyticus]
MKKNAYILTFLSLAVPAIIENSLQSFVGFADTFFISKIGLEEVAAVGVANAILQIYFAVFLALSTASAIYVSRYSGANDNEKVKQVVAQSIILTIIIGSLFGIGSFLFGEPLLRLMGANNEVLEKGLVYFRIVTTPSMLISLMYTVGAILRGFGDTKTPMRVGIIVNIVHIILDYILILGVFFQGFGLVGAAIATVLARFFGVILLFYNLDKKRLITKSIEAWKVNKEVIRGLIQVGIPTGLERLFMRFGQIIYFGMIIRMGTEIYAAHTLAGNLTIFSTIIGTGFAVATTTLIGKSLGAKNLESVKKYAKVSMIGTSIAMTMMTLVIYLTAPYTVTVFTTNTTVVHLIVVALAVDTIAQPATGLVSVLTAILQAGGDTKYPMYATAIGIWAIRTLGVYVLGVYIGLGLLGVWIAIAIDNYIRAMVLFIRYRSFKWVKKLSY